MALLRILISTNDSAQGLKDKLLTAAPGFHRSVEALENFLSGLANGSNSPVTIVEDSGAVRASGTITLSSIANNDTVTVNGRVYTAKTSGASGAQQFNIGGSDTNAAINLAAAINADSGSSLVAGVLTASVLSAGVVTTTAVWPGLEGNGLTIAISAHGSVSGSGLLTSGAAGTTANLSH